MICWVDHFEGKGEWKNILDDNEMNLGMKTSKIQNFSLFVDNRENLLKLPK